LLDEIEKAHPDVAHVLLQILEDGRLTDGQGRTVDFKNSIVVMTSNIGSELILEGGGVEGEAMRARLLQALRGHFRPELLNRIDDILVFDPLSQEALETIVRLELRKVETRLRDRELSLRVEPEVLALLAREGYDPAFGARPLRRLIERRVQNPLARAILEGAFRPGDTIRVRLGGGRPGEEDALRFERDESPQNASAGAFSA
ncbi:MAG TPA: AAA family ATPase, partial [Acidobacteriota bacterium]|nr:AAA family ATPase [Acidobacteriota bacterium]